MKLKFILIFFLIACTSLKASAQSTKWGQEAQLLSYNIGFGILSTTVGALINKPKNANAWSCVKRAVWQGALGGALQYAGKKMTYQITRSGYYWWGLGSKMVHSAGTSICYNAALGNPFGQYWALDYGAVRFNFNVKHGHVKFQPQFNLLFLYDIYVATRIGTVDYNASLKLGTLTFKSDKESLHSNFESGIAIGSAMTNTIVYSTINKTPNVIAHELVHIYQFNEYRVMNTYFEPLKKKIKSPVMKGIFKWVYVEIPNFAIMYGLNMPTEERYYKNFYEYEAHFFSLDSYVDR